MDNNAKYGLAFNRIPDIGQVRFTALKERFGSSSPAVLELKGLVKQVGSINYVLSPGARYENATAT